MLPKKVWNTHLRKMTVFFKKHFKHDACLQNCRFPIYVPLTIIRTRDAIASKMCTPKKMFHWCCYPNQSRYFVSPVFRICPLTPGNMNKKKQYYILEASYTIMDSSSSNNQYIKKNLNWLETIFFNYGIINAFCVADHTWSYIIKL